MGGSVRWIFAALFLLAALELLVCCSAENEGTGGDAPSTTDGTGTTDPGGGTTTPGGGTTTDPGGGTTTDPGGGTTTDPGGGTTPGGGTIPYQPPPEEQELDFSYIWICNSAESTVSKINTRTLEEEGRFLTRADRAGNPSRTSVNMEGDVAVGNRFGGAIKILARDCPDKNGDGQVRTSTGSNDVLPWGEDECVAWYWDATYASQRPIAWAPSTLEQEGGNVWLAGTSYPCGPADCQIDVIRLDGRTGQLKDKVTITGLGGPNRTDFISAFIPFGGIIIAGYGGYGGASDAQGHFWVFVSNTTQLVRVDAITLEYRIWDVPSSNGYGMTIDHLGRIFLCGIYGVSRFDPSNGSWVENNPGFLGFNGCMTDGAGTLWVGGGTDFGDPGLHGFDIETLQHLSSHPVGAVKGVSIDFDGYVWGVSGVGAFANTAERGTIAYRLDPNTGDVQSYNGLNGAYTYSDMTGFGLRSAGVIVPPIE